MKKLYMGFLILGIVCLTFTVDSQAKEVKVGKEFKVADIAPRPKFPKDNIRPRPVPAKPDPKGQVLKPKDLKNPNLKSPNHLPAKPDLKGQMLKPKDLQDPNLKRPIHHP